MTRTVAALMTLVLLAAPVAQAQQKKPTAPKKSDAPVKIYASGVEE